MNDTVAAAASALGIRIPSRGELVADGVIHAIGVAAGVVGSIILVAIAVLKHSYVEIIAVSIYAVGMVLMFSCSALYNIARRHRYREYFQRLDHSGIFLMIAGTYTAFTILMLKGGWALWLTALVWSVALVGIAIKLLWPKRLVGVTTGLYIALGWVGIIALEPIFTSLGVAALILLGAGGALYTVGVVFHLWERLPYQNAIWHGFVVAGAGTHYGAVITSLL
ncbi:MAG: hemolysin III family protein [Xanthobacteraceae bacterium]